MSSAAQGSAAPAPSSPTGRPVGELVVALGALALGLYTVVGAFGIAVPSSASVMGPRAFPVAVGLLLVAAAGAVLVGLGRGRRGEAEGGEDLDPTVRDDWRTTALVAAAFVAHLALVEVVGWAFAAAVLFGGTAWALGARPWWRGPLLGLALGLLVQLVFAAGLQVTLPPGPLLDLVPVLNGRGLGG